MSLLETFLKTTYVNVRSKARTDALHSAILETLRLNYPEYNEYDFEFEELVPDEYNGKMRVDILGTNKITGKKIVILCKCNNSNIGKNIYNIASNIIGEAARLIGKYSEVKYEKILFISVFPRIAPLFKNDGTIRSFDNVKTKYKNRINTSEILLKQYNGIAEEVNIFYDIENIYDKKSKKDFSNIVVSNISRMKLINEPI